MRDTDIFEEDIGFCIANAVDLIDPSMMDHHKKVASFAVSIAEEIGLSRSEQNTICIAGLLHDAGALSLTERYKISEFYIDQAYTTAHCERGHRLFNKFEPFSNIAKIIRYHHARWDNGKGVELDGEEVPFGSQIIFLADRIAVLTSNEINLMEQLGPIIEKINSQKDLMFRPDLVDAFNNLSLKTSFWLDAESFSSKDLFFGKKLKPLSLDEQDMYDLAKISGQLIDFRSRFTATHSSGVASTGAVLSRLAGFSPQETCLMKVGGYFHDIGKLAVPIEILEKPGKLSDVESNIMKSHPYYSYQSIELIPEMTQFNEWASFHHERLDGQGYPFKIEGFSLSLGSRIMAVADVFTALTENRPYRSGMSPDEAIKIIESLVSENKLDGYVVELLNCNFDEVDTLRTIAQQEAFTEYQEFELANKAA